MSLMTRYRQIPFRTRRLLHRCAIVGILLLAVASLVFGYWMIWLQRFVIYTRDGAVLDMDLDPTMQAGEPVKDPVLPEVGFEYLDEDESLDKDAELTQLKGYYITSNDLMDIPAVTERLKILPKGTPVMVEVKGTTGNFFYNSRLSDNRSGSIDAAAMDELIEFMNKRGLYTIATFPALRDYNYGLHHVEDGLPEPGGWLWMDNGAYWLNPGSQGTVSYLVSIITELRELGFDEVVLDDFYFPDSSSYVFKGNKDETLANTAQTLVTTCGTDRFAVSFVSRGKLPLPEGRSRLYLEKVAASRVEQVAVDSGLLMPQVQLVFITDIHDTRFDAYGVLRPIDSAF